jgi:RNA polymerase sigma-70 factor, ECF subfamily
MLTNEMRLVKAARKGNQEAFANLVRHHRQSIYMMALRLIRDPEDAQEVVQESLLKAYLHLGQFQGEARFSTWLGRITLNETLMRIRRRPPQDPISLDESGFPFEEHPLISQIADGNPEPEATCRNAELRSVVHRVVRTLAPRYRNVFVLRLIHDYSTRETAEILGLSATTVKTRLRRARVELRRRLKPFYASGCREGLAAFAARTCKLRSRDAPKKSNHPRRDVAV